MKTIKLRNGGKIVRVTENEIEKYLTKGYVIVETKKVEEAQKIVPQKPIIEESKQEVKVEPKRRTSKRKSNKQ